jgi:hypothetical protein
MLLSNLQEFEVVDIYATIAVEETAKEAGPRPSAEARVDAGRDAGPPWWRRFATDDPTAEEEQAPKDLVFSCSRKPSA